MTRGEQAAAAMMGLLLLFVLVLFISEWRRNKERKKLFKQWQTSLEKKEITWEDPSERR